MGEETSDTMNLDLNLGPGPEAGSGSVPSEAVNLDEWIDDPLERIREAVRISSRARQRWRWRQVQIPPETRTLSVELNQLIGNSDTMSTLQAGEGSVAAEARTNEVPKMCENNNGFLEDEVSEKKKKSDVEKGNDSDGSFFDCNICLDLANDPVVTCCGHLFCWPCLYRWLHVHSDAKECPVCKGEVTTKNVTPIYGRSNSTRVPEEDSSLEIPIRPQARRVDGWRQNIQRSAFSFPMDEMIRRLGSRLDLSRDSNSAGQEPNATREVGDRNSSILNRFMTLRGLRTDQNTVAPPVDLVDLTQSGTSSPTRHPRRFQSTLNRRSQSHRSSTHASHSSALNSSERFIEVYVRNHAPGRNQEQPQPVDDRDSFSSIAAVINSESQIDTAAEIDSVGTLSTSSSRRRNDTSRVSDVDAVDSRAPRRRRFN